MADTRPRIASALLLTAWCGLVGGWLEVAAVVLRKRFFEADQLYKTSLHFVWQVPLANLCVFLVLGTLGCIAVWIWPERGRWLYLRGLCALTFLPLLMIVVPRVYTGAWVLVALGVAVRLVPKLERDPSTNRRFVWYTFPAVVGLVPVVAGAFWANDARKLAREESRPRPPAGTPNVLLIVMDTVAAGHLSLHDYDRATCQTLVELAERGIRFDAARSASSWTLPSHATMFTGRWLHELSVGWLTPLDGARPTLAEYLGQKGYATAGFVGNTFYCGSDTGLARGFTHYSDFIFPELTALKSCVLVRSALEGYQTLVYLTEDRLEAVGLLPLVRRLWQAVDTNRKGAAIVNREFLEWLSGRQQPDRPFFAFLNYFDAHYPYQLAPGRLHRFGIEPSNNYQHLLIQKWLELDKTTVSEEGVAFARNSYDDCVADLDEKLGVLIDELDRRGILDHTWLVVTSDHGESFGEHKGVFCHGKSLYDTEVHVPLIVVPPGNRTRKESVKDAVSLRDLAATIAEVTGLAEGSPFPGDSLARFWQAAEGKSGPPPAALPTLAEVVPNNPGERDTWGAPAPLPPLGAVKESDWSYIRHENAAGEELFHLREDPKERRDVAGDPSARGTLDRLRQTMVRLMGGPLSAQRFRP
jgi:arylsulfatase A-like enzyme